MNTVRVRHTSVFVPNDRRKNSAISSIRISRRSRMPISIPIPSSSTPTLTTTHHLLLHLLLPRKIKKGIDLPPRNATQSQQSHEALALPARDAGRALHLPGSLSIAALVLAHAGLELRDVLLPPGAAALLVLPVAGWVVGESDLIGR